MREKIDLIPNVSSLAVTPPPIITSPSLFPYVYVNRQSDVIMITWGTKKETAERRLNRGK